MTVSPELHGNHIHCRQQVPFWEVVQREPCWRAISRPTHCSPPGWDSARLPTQLLCMLSDGAASGQLPWILSVCHSCSPCQPVHPEQAGRVWHCSENRTCAEPCSPEQGQNHADGRVVPTRAGQDTARIFSKNTQKCLLGRV